MWYSLKPDEPTGMIEVLKKADKYCVEHVIPFNLLVNLALRQFLGMETLDVAAVLEEHANERRGNLKDARKKLMNERGNHV